MTAMQITTGAVRQIRAGAGPRRLALAVWLAVAALGGAAFAQEGPGDGPGDAPGPAGLADDGLAPDGPSGLDAPGPGSSIETVEEILSEFLPHRQNGTEQAAQTAPEAEDDGVVGLIEAPEGAPGVDADTAAAEVIYPDDLAASDVAAFAETQPQAQARAMMPGPIGHPPVVVELFTSQGCSSCPPADKMLADLADRDDILALSWHVDYWDYLGWADEFARPEFTRRQQAYAHAWRERAIYTPQMIVGGTDTLIALRPAELMTLVDMQMARPAPVLVNASAQPDGGYRIELTPRAAIQRPVALLLVRYAPQRSMMIKAGENRGVTVNYRNVVLAVERVGEWDGRTPLRMNVQAGVESGDAFPEDTRHVILAQELGRGKGATGPILAAIRLD